MSTRQFSHEDLTDEQRQKLIDHCDREGKSVLNFWDGGKNIYVRLRLLTGHTETRYWYERRERIKRGRIKIDPARWKLVG